MIPEEEWTVADCIHHGQQYCHICPSYECCDNTTEIGKALKPVYKRIRELEFAVHKLKKLLPDE